MSAKTVSDHELVAALRRNADAIAEDMIAGFDAVHPDSSLRSLSLQERVSWIKVEMEQIYAIILGERRQTSMGYQPDVSSTCGTLPLGLASLLNVLENGLFIEDSVLPFLWNEFSSDADRLYSAVTRFKTGVRTFITENAETVASAIAEDLTAERAAAATEERERLAVEMNSRLSRYIGRLKEQTLLAQNLLAEKKVDEAIVALTTLKLTQAEVVEVLGASTLGRFSEKPGAHSADNESAERQKQFASAASSSLAALSRREVEVVGLVGAGKTNAEIAQSLHLAESTVKNYLVGILDKLGLSNRTQIAVFAERSGISHASEAVAGRTE